VTPEKNAENVPGVGGNYEQESGVEGNYELESEQEAFSFSRIQLKLHTGRMHQIRIHLAKNNCPICGDDQHGNFKLNKKLWKFFRIKHLLLCSYKLTLPINGKMQTFEIELPEEMKGRLGCKE
jgi:23S rRNA pseudouridine955/2504/2580 synthase